MDNFNNWLVSEGKDLFGFEKRISPEKRADDDMPIDPHRCGYNHGIAYGKEDRRHGGVL